ncbi:MAG: hypothetical protein HRU19_19100 [Pseudobacteriovorax sp.]|nr:hypothetical protein [Pseudobacteriovorax sp.]
MTTHNHKEIQHARNTLKKAMRDFFEKRGYTEVETPILVRTPGTETYLDYFSTEWADHQERQHTRYLRSSPELHLKQYLGQGFDKIFELAPCFRNGGEYSEWHNPEFMMLEYYETDISFESFITLTWDLIRHCQSALANEGLSVIHLQDDLKKFKVADVFAEATGIELIDQDPLLAQKAVEKGYPSCKLSDDFETTFFKLMLDYVEPLLAKYQSSVIFDYPKSQSALAKVQNGLAKRFEFYLLGHELCNGFDELVDANENQQRYSITQKLRKDIGKTDIPHDPYFIDSLRDGIPESCGNALGFDRLLAILLGKNSIEDVIPFRGQAFSDQL